MIPDEDLFREWQQGSTGALEALVRRHHATLLAHLVRITGNPSLAEDLVQETFLRLVRNGHTYRYPRPFIPWLYAIARHLALNYWQSAPVRREREAACLGDPPGAKVDPSDWIERWERREGLRTALAQLTFEQREVLSLRFGQELSVQQTSAILGIPAGTVKSRCFTALRRLRDILSCAEDIAGEQEGGHRHG